MGWMEGNGLSASCILGSFQLDGRVSRPLQVPEEVPVLDKDLHQSSGTGTRVLFTNAIQSSPLPI